MSVQFPPYSQWYQTPGRWNHVPGTKPFGKPGRPSSIKLVNNPWAGRLPPRPQWNPPRPPHRIVTRNPVYTPPRPIHQWNPPRPVGPPPRMMYRQPIRAATPQPPRMMYRQPVRASKPGWSSSLQYGFAY